MAATVLLMALAFAPDHDEKTVTDDEKREFLMLLSKLPTKGEFFTEEAVKKAAPFARVLFALTPKDTGPDIYPFLALSSGLIQRKEQRDYALKHFDKIAH